MIARLALMRHGHTAWNREHRIQGRTDIPLDDAAREELARLTTPTPWDRATLWSSALSRARETARLITGRTPHVTEALMEMDWGNWEGRHGVDLRGDFTSGYRDIEDWGWQFTPPGGESPQVLRARLEPWMASLTEDNLAICHIGVMRVALALAWGWDFKGPCPFAIKRNRLYILERRSDAWFPHPDALRLRETAA
jgi:broad specificity phosphatase PhoE